MRQKNNFLVTIFLFVLLALSSCGVSEADIATTQTQAISKAQTEVYATLQKEAYKQSFHMTQTEAALHPRPTSTPQPTKTFEEKVAQCEKSGSGVRYVLTGNNVSGASVTLQNDTGGTEQGDFKVPYCKTLTGFSNGDFLYISAQILNGSGTLTCKIYSGNELVSQATASGEFSIATCDASK